MGSTELSANLFRISQTEEKLKKIIYKQRKMLAIHIIKLEKLLEKQLKRLVELCQKIYQHQRKV